MNKYKRTVRIPTKQFAFEEIEVMMEFDAKTTDAEAWAKVDEAVDLKVDLIEAGVALDSDFPDKSSSKETAQTTPTETKSAQTAPQTTQPKEFCNVHQIQMEERTSRTKKDANGHFKRYWAHGVGVEICFGNEREYTV